MVQDELLVNYLNFSLGVEEANMTKLFIFWKQTKSDLI